MQKRDKWYLRIEKAFDNPAEYVCVGEDRGHALARLNACKITEQQPRVELYRIKETAGGVALSAVKVAVKDKCDGYQLIEESVT